MTLLDALAILVGYALGTGAVHLVAHWVRTARNRRDKRRASTITNPAP